MFEAHSYAVGSINSDISCILVERCNKLQTELEKENILKSQVTANRNICQSECWGVHAMVTT